MRESALPSPGIGGRGHHLRRVAASAISQIEVTGPKHVGGKHPAASKLRSFFAACADSLVDFDNSPLLEDLDTTPPTITSGATANVAENTTTVMTCTANETVLWSVTGGADLAKFTINAGTGALAFASAPNFEAPTDADENNVYVVIVTATDLDGNTASKTVSVTVTDVGE